MSREAYQDEAIILRVTNWQTADKYAVCFSRGHGKIAFIAYGAAYPRNNSGRLVQPFAQLAATFTPGRKVETLKSCESLVRPKDLDIEALAYSAVIAEVTDSLTTEGESDPYIYALLLEAMALLQVKNKRLVTVSTLLKLLSAAGFAPCLDVCTSCGIKADADGFFSLVQGGFLCSKCAQGDELPLSLATKELMLNLQQLDFTQPPSFTVKGSNLMELEQILYKFILYQTDRPLKSLNFLAQLGR